MEIFFIFTQRDDFFVVFISERALHNEKERYIYIERAREIALIDAEIEDAGRVEFTVEELVDGGIKTPYYLFRFNNGRTQWTYRIDATNGGIQFTDKEELK